MTPWSCPCRQSWYQLQSWRHPEKKRQEEGRRAFLIASCQKKVWARTWRNERNPRTTRPSEGNVRERESQLCTSPRPNIWPNLEVNNSWEGRGRKERRDTFIQVLWNVRGSQRCRRGASDVKERTERRGGGGGGWASSKGQPSATLENAHRQLQSQKDVGLYGQSRVLGPWKGQVPEKEAEGKEGSGGLKAERLSGQKVGSKENILPDLEEFIPCSPFLPGLFATSKSSKL